MYACMSVFSAVSELRNNLLIKNILLMDERRILCERTARSFRITCKRFGGENRLDKTTLPCWHMNFNEINITALSLDAYIKCISKLLHRPTQREGLVCVQLQSQRNLPGSYLNNNDPIRYIVIYLSNIYKLLTLTLTSMEFYLLAFDILHFDF